MKYETAINILSERMRREEKTKIAIQKDGRLSDIAWNLLETCLEAAGLERQPRVLKNKRTFVYSLPELPSLKIGLLRQSDIPSYVESGTVDFGIIGGDQFLEKRPAVRVVDTLDTLKCSLAIAVPMRSKIQKPEDLRDRVIATSFPRLLGTYLVKKDVLPKKIVTLSGSVEAAPALGRSDAICDLVESGETLRANELRKIQIIRNNFKALLIGSIRTQ